jgi:RNA polymerase sigma factor for flagellar operon FliA
MRTQTNRRETRDQIVSEHLGLVHHIARRMQRQLSTEASLDDLVSAGSVGLLNAAENFDASRGLAFSTFAMPRIRGAILDDLRSQDRVPRSVRRKARAMTAAREKVTQRTGRIGTEREVAEELGVGVETVWEWNTDVAAADRVSMDAHSSADEDSVGAWQFAADDEAADDAVAREDLADRLRVALETLPARERQVIALYYYEDLTQQQIAQVLHVTESRVSQLRTQAIKRLRNSAVGLRAEFVA